MGHWWKDDKVASQAEYLNLSDSLDNSIQADDGKNQIDQPSLSQRHHLKDFTEYEKLYAESIQSPETFWAAQAHQHLSWSKDFSTVSNGSLQNGDVCWFLEGELNACYNTVDRHAFAEPGRVAILFQGDEPGDVRQFTYGELLREVSRVAWVLRDLGVRKGDVVVIYMPVIPEAMIAMLACVRIGAVHSAVFAGFSSTALRDRILDASAKVLITSNESRRGGKTIGLKSIVDVAVDGLKVKSLVYQRTAQDVSMTKGRDFWWHQEVEKWPSYLPPTTMNSEDPMFLLYTSGSTGKPKGLMHTTAGYLLGAAMTTKYIFDVQPGDKFFCAGDIGWITGHTYGLYGPLLLGVTTVMYEGTPTYPSPSRFWEIIDSFGCTQLHTAPTVLRLLKRAGDEHVNKEMKSLRVVGSVGEPLAAEVWNWYHDVVGKKRAHVVDTYFQTETGSNVLAPLAGITSSRAGSVSLPFFGIEPAILNPLTGVELKSNSVEGILAFRRPWPSMARTVYGAHKRFMDTYLSEFKGYYFTGDGARRDAQGLYSVSGRVDDVVNLSGHRLSTAEIEAALLTHTAVAEAAAIGVLDDLTGQALNAFVVIKEAAQHRLESNIDAALKKELVGQVRAEIGSFAAPKVIFIVKDLPKTRSGKIMRRILRKILAGEEDQLGDLTTLANPSSVEQLVEYFRLQKS